MLWFIEGKTFTCGVVTDTKGIIIEAAPILRKFMGQHLSSLKDWAQVNKITHIR